MEFCQRLVNIFLLKFHFPCIFSVFSLKFFPGGKMNADQCGSGSTARKQTLTVISYEEKTILRWNILASIQISMIPVFVLLCPIIFLRLLYLITVNADPQLHKISMRTRIRIQFSVAKTIRIQDQEQRDPGFMQNYGSVFYNSFLDTFFHKTVFRAFFIKDFFIKTFL